MIGHETIATFAPAPLAREGVHTAAFYPMDPGEQVVLEGRGPISMRIIRSIAGDLRFLFERFSPDNEPLGYQPVDLAITDWALCEERFVVSPGGRVNILYLVPSFVGQDGLHGGPALPGNALGQRFGTLLPGIEQSTGQAGIHIAMPELVHPDTSQLNLLQPSQAA